MADKFMRNSKFVCCCRNCGAEKQWNKYSVYFGSECPGMNTFPTDSAQCSTCHQRLSSYFHSNERTYCATDFSKECKPKCVACKEPFNKFNKLERIIDNNRGFVQCAKCGEVIVTRLYGLDGKLYFNEFYCDGPCTSGARSQQIRSSELKSTPYFIILAEFQP